MKSFSFKAISAVAAISASVAISGNALAKVEGDTITLGSAISLTGKYSTNGLHTSVVMILLLIVSTRWAA